MQVRLRHLFDRRGGPMFVIPASEFLIGRAHDCHLHLPSPLASRHHCEIRVDPGRVVVHDLHSLNGTFVNGHRIDDAQELNSGDVLGAGMCFYEVLIVPPAEESGRLAKGHFWAPLWRRFFRGFLPAASPTPPAQNNTCAMQGNSHDG